MGMKTTAKKSSFDLKYLKQKIQRTQPDEICILSGGFYNYYHMEQDMWEWLSEQLGHYCYINDYQDLCCDPHGIMEDK